MELVDCDKFLEFSKDSLRDKFFKRRFLPEMFGRKNISKIEEDIVEEMSYQIVGTLLQRYLHTVSADDYAKMNNRKLEDYSLFSLKSISNLRSSKQSCVGEVSCDLYKQMIRNGLEAFVNLKYETICIGNGNILNPYKFQALGYGTGLVLNDKSLDENEK